MDYKERKEQHETIIRITSVDGVRAKALEEIEELHIAVNDIEHIVSMKKDIDRKYYANLITEFVDVLAVVEQLVGRDVIQDFLQEFEYKQLRVRHRIFNETLE
jgi:type I site-specific restriction endonuclease